MIRKISIGADYKNAMHYTVGQYFRHLKINAIVVDSDGYNIYVEDEDGAVMLWKKINKVMPVVLEYDITGF